MQKFFDGFDNVGYISRTHSAKYRALLSGVGWTTGKVNAVTSLFEEEKGPINITGTRFRWDATYVEFHLKTQEALEFLQI